MGERSLTYRSCATRQPTPSDIDRLIERAQAFNRGMNVTGFLIFRNGSFIQTIEGPAENIEIVFDRIKRDQSHSDIAVLGDAPIQQRIYPQWAMMNDSALGVALVKVFLNAALARAPVEVTLNQRSMIFEMLVAVEEQAYG